MTKPELSAPNAASGAHRKPRIAIMGEFSAGKSTLSNLLVGSDPLPVKVTATQLPPVWISYGDAAPCREDLQGNILPVDPDHLGDIPLHETAVIRIYLKADILRLCDIIDMPGISDPNMPAEVWERIIPEADGVLWCTHATQAWRQSEAAVWKSLPGSLMEKSFLLITRIDKLLSDRDRQKVIRRVSRETDGLFARIFPISLTQAITAQDDQAKWAQSGAGEFIRNLVQMLRDISGEPEITPDVAVEPGLLSVQEPQAADPAQNVLVLDERVKRPAVATGGVMPARVKVSAVSGRPTRRPAQRPARPDVSLADGRI